MSDCKRALARHWHNFKQRMEHLNQLVRGVYKVTLAIGVTDGVRVEEARATDVRTARKLKLIRGCWGASHFGN
jgi:hypothetical protein